MKCPRCQHENRSGAKFCEECATPLARTCSNCGSQLSATAKFCPECAHPVAGPTPEEDRFASPQSYTPKHLAEKILTSKAALEGERKQVTMLFADLKGSIELLADRDPEEARKILDPVLERMMEAVHRYEGTVNQVMGDGIKALFGAPLAHEDHAVRACYAARALSASNSSAWKLRAPRRSRPPSPRWSRPALKQPSSWDGTMFARHRQRLSDIALKRRLPTMSGGRHFAEAGSLLAYGAFPRELCQRSAANAALAGRTGTRQARR
jgi:Double zinc ribbon